MRYALISDIHGNLPALSAALADARARGVDRRVYLGDYYLGSPYANEVIDIIRADKTAIVIKGNQEDYIKQLESRDPATWTDGQFSPLYWYYKTLTRARRAWLTTLDASAEISYEGVGMRVSHSSLAYIGETELNLFPGMRAPRDYADASDPLASMREDIISEITKSADCAMRIRALDKGVYAFGHTHRQWHGWFEGRLLINPGSCGLALDRAGGAPYTILDISAGNVSVEERRVKYDAGALVRALYASDLYKSAPIWCENTMDELMTNWSHVETLFENVEKYANEVGDTQRPYTLDTWTRAFERWHKRDEAVERALRGEI